ncbi:hypothetical protein B0H63DRAFT_44489 [Podospora didyma]|uniref:Uncharacterized protein n=1 Tax=Podospora didyma TaxID=330526 RepID=A0AAE0P6S9_9PEZI|nr:hypothetical protein B0H63DRAFT_44489 [Podospora didyma]
MKGFNHWMNHMTARDAQTYAQQEQEFYAVTLLYKKCFRDVESWRETIESAHKKIVNLYQELCQELDDSEMEQYLPWFKFWVRPNDLSTDDLAVCVVQEKAPFTAMSPLYRLFSRIDEIYVAGEANIATRQFTVDNNPKVLRSLGAILDGQSIHLKVLQKARDTMKEIRRQVQLKCDGERRGLRALPYPFLLAAAPVTDLDPFPVGNDSSAGDNSDEGYSSSLDGSDKGSSSPFPPSSSSSGSSTAPGPSSPNSSSGHGGGSSGGSGNTGGNDGKNASNGGNTTGNGGNGVGNGGAKTKKSGCPACGCTCRNWSGR